MGSDLFLSIIWDSDIGVESALVDIENSKLEIRTNFIEGWTVI